MRPIGQVPSNIVSLTKEFGTIANNIANASTAGFKRTVNSFSKELQAMQESAGTVSTLKEMRGLIVSRPDLDLTQGTLVKTERNLDVAIVGNGWFTIETQDGRLYTKNGTFVTNSTGQLVDSQGNIVAGADGPIVIPSNISVNDLGFSDDGTISAGNVKIGQLNIVNFGEQESKLKPVGQCMFRAPAGIEPEQAKDIRVQQGYQEASNVNITEELVDLIKVMRMYEANMKIISKNQEVSKSILEVAAR